MALLNFQEKNDTKAAILVFIAYSSGPVSSIMRISQSIEINDVTITARGRRRTLL